MKNGMMCSFFYDRDYLQRRYTYTPTAKSWKFHRSLPDRENCKKYRIDIRAHEGRTLKNMFSEIDTTILA